MNCTKLTGLLCLLTAMGCSAAPAENTQGKTDALAPSWLKADWFIPPAFGLDRDGDGLVDLAPPKAAYQPQSYHVTLNACSASPPQGTVTSYTFEVFFPDHVDTRTTTSCTSEYDLPASTPSYSARITAAVSDGSAGVQELLIAPRTYVIVSMGDSIASGEGNPDIGIPNLRWVDTRCHRSASSGHARAARLIEDADPHTSVAFLSVACSGAGIAKGILGEYEGQDPGMNLYSLEPQLTQVLRALCPFQRTCMPAEMPKIDALFLQVGADDVEFGELARRCAYPDDCTGHIPSSFHTAMDQLPSLYDNLARTLQSSLNLGTVYATEYPDPTMNDSGAYCDSVFEGAIDDNFSTGARTALGAILGFVVGGPPVQAIGAVAASHIHDGDISPSENAWAHDNVVVPLNQAFMAAANRNRWLGISGAAAQFANHGYCANDHYIRRYEESKATQGNVDGTLHPNQWGYSIYASELSTSFLSRVVQPQLPEDAYPASPAAWGFLWSGQYDGQFTAHEAYTRSSMISSTDTRGIVPLITEWQTGYYVVQFPKLGSYPGGNVQVTADGAGSKRCKPVGWFPQGDTEFVYVRCMTSADVPADELFTASYISESQTAGSEHGYLLADQPTTDNYTPSSTWQFNSTGASNTVHRDSVGHCSAFFPGLSLTGGGTVEVSAVGWGNEICKVGSWGPQTVNVLCFDSSGNPVDSVFSLRFGSRNFAGGRSWAYAWANNSTAEHHTPASFWQAVNLNTTCGSTPSQVTIDRDDVGHYTVSVPLLSSTGSTVMVTAYGPDNNVCKVSGWWGGSTHVEVRCFDLSGQPVDSQFVINYVTDESYFC